MEKGKKIYNIINIIVILLAGITFIRNYGDIAAIFGGMSIFSLFVMIVTAVAVHIVKAGRLYLAIYGADMSINTHLKIYCKVVSVSVVFPYKIGDIFRMYCYGLQLENILRGAVIILFDRFVDTAALVTAILMVWLFSGGYVTAFVYALMIFLVLVLFIYCVLPEVCRFWKRYLLKAAATENRLMAIAILERVSRIYREVEGVVRGKGIILYFMSLSAWGVEIASVALLGSMADRGTIGMVIASYLTSAISGNQSVELKRFVFVSVALLAILYCMIKFFENVAGKKVHR